MGNIYPTSELDVRSIQPYFVLSTQSIYYKKTVGDSVVSHFYSFIADKSEGHTFAVPDASVDILFLCDAENSAARICGSATSAKKIELKKDKRYFGIRFIPGFTPSFPSILPKELIGAEFALSDLDKNASSIIEKMAEQLIFTEQINVFMHHYQPHLLNKQSAVIRQLNHLIHRHNGDIRITELEAQTGLSARYIYKLFMEHFGLSPKAYCLILRFQKALLSLTGQNNSNLTDLAVELGYADQSHFLREFKKFAAISPKKFSTRIKQDFYQARLNVED